MDAEGQDNTLPWDGIPTSLNTSEIQLSRVGTMPLLQTTQPPVRQDIHPDHHDLIELDRISQETDSCKSDQSRNLNPFMNEPQNSFPQEPQNPFSLNSREGPSMQPAMDNVPISHTRSQPTPHNGMSSTPQAPVISPEYLERHTYETNHSQYRFSSQESPAHHEQIGMVPGANTDQLRQFTNRHRTNEMRPDNLLDRAIPKVNMIGRQDRNAMNPNNNGPLYYLPNNRSGMVDSFQVGGHRPAMRHPDIFDGESVALDDYLGHFELIAAWNDWTDEERAIQLGASLRGSAQRVLGDMAGSDRLNYAKLKNALEQRFSPRDRQLTHKMELKTRRRKRGESLQDFGFALRRLATQAYPNYPSSASEEMTIDYFIQGLDSVELKKHIRLSRPQTIEAAISIAAEYEAVDADVSRAASKPRAAGLYGEGQTKEGTYAQSNGSKLTTELQQYGEGMKQLSDSMHKLRLDMKRQKTRERTKPKVDEAQARAQGLCYECGAPDHQFRNCPHREKRLEFTKTRVDSHSRGWRSPRKSNSNMRSPQSQFKQERQNTKSVGIRDQDGGCFIEGKLLGENVNFFIDTGSSYSVISEELYAALPSGGKPTLRPVEKKIRMISGECLPMKGYGNFRTELAGELVDYPFIVATSLDPVLIGIDMLTYLHANLDLRNRKLIVKGVEYPLFKNTQQDCLRVHVKETKEIPALHEAHVTCRVERNPNFEMPQEGIVEPNKDYRKQSGLLISSALVRREGDEVPLTIINPYSTPVKIEANTPIATFQGMSESVPLAACITSDGEKLRQGKSEDPVIPPHLKPLIDGASDDLTKKELKLLGNTIVEYQDVFMKPGGKLGRTNLVEHRIDTGDARPIKQPPRRIPLAQKVVVEQELQKMFEQDIIETSDSAWSSPVVLVRKKDGSVRFCVDYRKLNNVTKKDAYPLPRIDDTIDTLAGAQWFCTLDLASGYWQVSLAPQDREKSAFVTHKGLFQFKVLPFGLCNAPSNFERLLERVLQGLLWQTCLVYIDDCIVFGKDFSSTLTNLKQVLQKFREASLKLKPSKCTLFKKSVLFLGHVVSSEGVQCDPNKINAVKEWPTPKTVKEVRSFLGLCSYYRRFLAQFSEIVAPLVNLTRKNVPFRWTEACESAFHQIKIALTNAPVLAYPTTTGRFILDTDASAHSVGAVLSQIQEGEEKVIAYSSRTLTHSQKNYCATKRELLAIIIFVKQFRPYLWGRNFLVRTDHASLTWLLNFKEPEGMLARWISILDTYDYTIEHRPGSKHGNADGLSRRPCGQCKREECTEPVKAVRRAHVENDTSYTLSFADWCDTLNMADLKTLQGADPAIRRVIALILSFPDRKPPWRDIARDSREVKALWVQWDNLVIQNDILYRRWRPSDKMPWVHQLVTPGVLRKKIMHLVHDKRLAGHLGVAKTVHNVRNRFYWPGHKDDIKRWCRRCNICAAQKPRPGPRRAPLQQRPTGDKLECIALDVLGPLPITENGNQYILVATDYFSKWTQAWALPDHTAMTIAEKLVVDMFLLFGCPLQIHTDQGRDFESKLMKELCKLLEIDKTRTVSYHPQSDGQTERFNRTLLAMLTSFVDENQTNWDDILPYVLSAYRSTVHQTTQCSPNLLFLGNENRMPVDLLFGSPTNGDSIPACPNEYVEWVRSASQIAHEYAREHKGVAAERQKKYYDMHVTTRKFMIGDWVWFYYPPEGEKKLGKGWKGPFLVTKVLNEVNYKIQIGPNTKPRVAHVDQLKNYEGDPLRRSWLPNDHTELDNEGHPQGKGEKHPEEEATSDLSDSEGLGDDVSFETQEAVEFKGPQGQTATSSGEHLGDMSEHVSETGELTGEHGTPEENVTNVVNDNDTVQQELVSSPGLVRSRRHKRPTDRLREAIQQGSLPKGFMRRFPLVNVSVALQE